MKKAAWTGGRRGSGEPLKEAGALGGKNTDHGESPPQTADRFAQELRRHQSVQDLRRNARIAPEAEDNELLGVRHKTIFDLAKKYVRLPLTEIETLLESPYYEIRLGAVSIMDFQAQRRGASGGERRALFHLYLRRHDRINHWDLVDRAAKRVVGGYLYEFKVPRDLLFKLARSEDPWERRTALVATSYFIGKGELGDTFAVADMLLDDDHVLIQKAAGSWIREAGKKNQKMLTDFLDQRARHMPRAMLRNAIGKLPADLREKYLAL